MSNLLYDKPFTAVLAVPLDLRGRGARSELELYYWHGDAKDATVSASRAQGDAAEAYGVLLSRASEFTVMFVFAGYHRDLYYQAKRLTAGAAR